MIMICSKIILQAWFCNRYVITICILKVGLVETSESMVVDKYFLSHDDNDLGYDWHSFKVDHGSLWGHNCHDHVGRVCTAVVKKANVDGHNNNEVFSIT